MCSNLSAMRCWRRSRSMNGTRRPFADVDIALHVGEVLYGNVGAADRLDFTVIGPAVNEVVRMEKLCEPCSHLGLLRLRDAVTDAWSRSDDFNCAASMRPRRFLG